MMLDTPVARKEPRDSGVRAERAEALGPAGERGR
jgi:hypothetical protein